MRNKQDVQEMVAAVKVCRPKQTRAKNLQW